MQTESAPGPQAAVAVGRALPLLEVNRARVLMPSLRYRFGISAPATNDHLPRLPIDIRGLSPGWLYPGTVWMALFLGRNECPFPKLLRQRQLIGCIAPAHAHTTTGPWPHLAGDRSSNRDSFRST